MHNSNASKHDFEKKITQLHLDFENAVLSLEQKNYEASLLKSEQTLKGLDQIVDALEKNYKESFLQYKLKHFDLIKNQLSLFRSADDISGKFNEYTHLLMKLRHSINAVNEEINKNYPEESVFSIFYKNHKKNILLCLLVILIIVGISIFGYNYKLNRQGLTGQYFSKSNFTRLFRVRVDKKIDFVWGTASPLPRWKTDKFSIRWTGYLHVPQDGEYEFYTHSDDGVKLWLGGKEIISNWTTHRTTVNRVKLNLQAGYHSIKLEYFDSKRRATIRLFWKPEFEPRAVPIPSKYLIPSKQFIRNESEIIDDDQAGFTVGPIQEDPVDEDSESDEEK